MAAAAIQRMPRFLYDSFNDVALLDSMSDNVSTPRSRGRGTMAAAVRYAVFQFWTPWSHARRKVYIRIVLRVLPG
jgi:hypothetical protein